MLNKDHKTIARRIREALTLLAEHLDTRNLIFFPDQTDPVVQLNL